jgi:hypothetical protein
MVRVGGVYPVQTRMFQPKSECELFIRVVKVYCQRLVDMSMVDYLKEGGIRVRRSFGGFGRRLTALEVGTTTWKFGL